MRSLNGKVNLHLENKFDLGNKHYRCRFCDEALKYPFVDLGTSPLANSYLKEKDLHRMEPFYPLCAYVCESCFLVQVPVFESPEDIFSDYAYFSSYSDSWLKHAKDYVDSMIDRFGFDADTQIVEIASNDGYLLQYFKEKGIPVLGIEPAKNVGKAALEKGIPTIIQFHSEKTAKELSVKGIQADLLIGNNVLAHVPNLNDFVRGMKIILKSDGIITMEFPHLMRLMEENQFDTIYHEHFSYFSLISVNKIFSEHDLSIFDVEELPTHGGSLRIYVSHAEDSSKALSKKVNALMTNELAMGFDKLDHYLAFGEQVKTSKLKILDFLVEAKREGKSIAGYGAPAKGNTLLNYCGIRTDFIDYTVDRNPHKQGCFLPGTRIPIFHPDKFVETKPDYVIILPWNLKDEIMEQMAHIHSWGASFATLIPDVTIHR
jgi:2-polyprenyl-3-methyl-5-hydroxy-6-metoxy-1,4-benzoquinol methylase